MTYEAWRCTYQSSEQAARAAYERAQELEKQLAAVQQGVQPEGECSATYGMNITQRILHVGGRENAQTYIEFGSVEAVRMLVAQVLRDLPNGYPDFCSPTTHPTQQGLDVVAAAKALCKHAAKVQNVNFDDYWLIHGEEFKQEVQIVLDAAQAKQGGANA